MERQRDRNSIGLLWRDRGTRTVLDYCGETEGQEQYQTILERQRDKNSIRLLCRDRGTGTVLDYCGLWRGKVTGTV